MTELTVHNTEHRITISAPVEAVYGLLADVIRWPQLFGPTVHTEQVERTETTERIRIWATANDEVKTWTSRRELDPVAHRITFRQEVSQPPVAAMGGAWVLSSTEDGGTLVVLEHDFSAVDDLPENVDWVSKAVDRNSEHELANLKQIAENLSATEDLLISFDDVVEIEGDRADVYRFLYRSQDWPDRLPHVARLDLVEDVPGIQLMEMDTKTADGSMHTTKSVRVCTPESVIVYKQLKVPALMTVHTGRWTLEEAGTGVRATSTHTVVIKPDAVTKILGEQATVDDAKAFVRKALGTNSTTTLRYAKEFAEAARAGR
ncbi:SRPBCC family protein [Kutzneria viridogrisea]|uniref:Coenzyme Q-binding protein COQ10 START domain-containing protein n=2 Tax=Kutzneria TaxID=43356 RepID=W5WKW7_9PSEU|nr:aromatase/cyclase [Kutzneria albida]AHI01182.1 hypothetical protein KALB_7824 [Kutzneria albida DSM 43870]MBA8926435.1 aromatase [Kutzneria viridogrisea]